MAEDPRRFIVKNCQATRNLQAGIDTKRKDFFNSLGKIGDIEALNDLGVGNISAGLRDLTKISNSIRTGDTDSAIIPNGSKPVFDAVGINNNAAQQAGRFNPGVLNRATSQAENIMDSVKAGKYNLSDIPNTFSDLQNLNQLVDGIFNDGTSQNSTKVFELCGASPYAVDLIQYAPKYKFLFIVQITLAPEYQSLDHSGDHLAFVVKTSTRPNINIDHEEINMYNFWTRIPKRVIYEPITMRFYDDNKGLAHLFYTSYLESISPISRLGNSDGTIGTMGIDELESISMFNNSQRSSASIQALKGKNTSIITEIRLFHMYDYGRFMNIYHFHHPKLLTMNLDELDMAEAGTGNEIEFQFAYDAMHITPAFKVQENVQKVKEITGLSIGANYPIKPNFLDGDVSTAPEGIDGDGNIISSLGAAASNLVSTGLSAATGLVSNAFSAVANFGGSIFR